MDRVFGLLNRNKINKSLKLLFTFVSILSVLGLVFRTAVNEAIEKVIPEFLRENYSAIILSLLFFTATAFLSINQKILNIELQETIRGKLHSLFTIIKNNESKTIEDKYLNNLQNEILSETYIKINQIHSITDDSVLEINDEFKRVEFIRYLFANTDYKEVLAVTYDHNNYFINFWSGLNFGKFIEVNKTAASKHAIIRRIFIFNRANFNKHPEKQELYNKILGKLNSIPNIYTDRVWEEDLVKKFPAFPKKSFLIIDNRITSEIQDSHSSGYLAIKNQTSIEKLGKRFEQLSSLI